jgi:predicted homoserine dehydrogenase-like protein
MRKDTRVNLQRMALEHARDSGPIGVALIGAGKFGSMFLTQAPSMPGIEVRAIADLYADRVPEKLAYLGWEDQRIAGTRITNAADEAVNGTDIDVVVEATGDPIAGIAHALMTIAAGKHLVMVTVEADALAGPALAARARAAGTVYSLAYGDQPALIAELVDWARACGFRVTAAGKGTKYLPEYHTSTPDTVWPYYGLTATEAAAGGMNSQMFNSFLDGTKSAIEMAAVANACGLQPPEDGLDFPPCSIDDLAATFAARARQEGFPHRGIVEVVSSLQRDGTPVAQDLRWGVYVVFEALTDYASACFHQYGMRTDESGRYGAMYRPYHLIGMELGISIYSAALRGEPTGSPRAFRGDVVAVAKRDLAPGARLDGEGGFTVWGKLVPAQRSIDMAALPIGFAKDVLVARPVAAGQVIREDDVTLEPSEQALAMRQETLAMMAE